MPLNGRALSPLKLSKAPNKKREDRTSNERANLRNQTLPGWLCDHTKGIVGTTYLTLYAAPARG